MPTDVPVSAMITVILFFAVIMRRIHTQIFRDHALGRCGLSAAGVVVVEFDCEVSLPLNVHGGVDERTEVGIVNAPSSSVK